MSKVALLDGDSWVYRCGFAAEKTYYLVTHDSHEMRYEFDKHADAVKHNKVTFGDSGVVWSRKEVEPLENCLQMVKTSLENTLKVLGTNDYTLYISGRGNFRDDIFPDYKSNRDGVSKPKYFRDIRDYLVSQWGARLVDGMEPDDAVGMAATAAGQSAVIVAVDKDLNQIPGHHYNWTTGESFDVSPKQGMRFFYEQLLSGDPTDNIPGLAGVGPVKARKILELCSTPQECARVVLTSYSSSGGRGHDAALDEIRRNAKLVWIRRTGAIDNPFERHLGA